MEMMDASDSIEMNITAPILNVFELDLIQFDHNDYLNNSTNFMNILIIWIEIFLTIVFYFL